MRMLYCLTRTFSIYIRNVSRMGFVFVLRLRRTDIPECEKYPDIHEGRALFYPIHSKDENTTHLRIVMVFIFSELQIIQRT